MSNPLEKINNLYKTNEYSNANITLSNYHTRMIEILENIKTETENFSDVGKNDYNFQGEVCRNYDKSSRETYGELLQLILSLEAKCTKVKDNASRAAVVRDKYNK